MSLVVAADGDLVTELVMTLLLPDPALSITILAKLLLSHLRTTHMFPLPLKVTFPDPRACVSPGAVFVVSVSLASQRHRAAWREFLNKDVNVPENS